MTGHAHVEHGSDKRIALLIAILALFLAIAETGAKSAQTEGISRNVEAANLWAFFQARTIRQTNVRTAAEAARARPAGGDGCGGAGGHCPPAAVLAGHRGAVGERAADRRGKARADGAGQGGRGDPGPVAGRLPHARIRLGRLPGGDRAGLRPRSSPACRCWRSAAWRSAWRAWCSAGSASWRRSWCISDGRARQRCARAQTGAILAAPPPPAPWPRPWGSPPGSHCRPTHPAREEAR